MLEAMRLAPVVPLALPHFTDVDVNVSNTAATSAGSEMTISAGSIVIANLWSVGRDPHVWNGDADIFYPERFLRDANTGAEITNAFSDQTRSCPFVAKPHDDKSVYNSAGITENVEYESGSRSLVVDRKLTEWFYPFSFGARRCVGESLGRLQIFIFFATIMRSCRLLQPEGKPPPSDGETYGDVIRPAPYEIRILPRHV